MNNSKVCNRCSILKTFDNFFRCSQSSDGHYTICKQCKTESTLKWRSNNRETYNSGMRAYNKKNSRRIHYKRAYKMTPDEYNEMLLKQESVCAICKIKNKSIKRPLVIDHCHSTGKVRGILCYGCNRLMVLLDNDELFKRAVLYKNNNLSSSS